MFLSVCVFLCCTELTCASAGVWLSGQSGDYKDAIWFYSRIIWPLFTPLSFLSRPMRIEGPTGE